jgi:hypothetical protein
MSNIDNNVETSSPGKYSNSPEKESLKAAEKYNIPDTMVRQHIG